MSRGGTLFWAFEWVGFVWIIKCDFLAYKYMYTLVTYVFLFKSDLAIGS